MRILYILFAVGISIAVAHPSKVNSEFDDEVNVACANCLLDPCSISTCPRYPTAVCRTSCATCTAQYFKLLKTSPWIIDVTSSCDPCATVKCSAGKQCYYDSAFNPYCASACSASFTCPTGYYCQKYPNICDEELEMTGCGYYGFCLKN